MCHAIIWELPCGHRRVLRTNCDDYSSESTPLGSSSSCPTLFKTYGDLDNKGAFCTEPKCQYQGRGWWCCSCLGRNVGHSGVVCRNSQPPALVGNPLPGPSRDEPRPSTEPGPSTVACDHRRCAGCTSDRLHHRVVSKIEEMVAAHKIDDNGNVNENEDDGQAGSKEGGSNDDNEGVDEDRDDGQEDSKEGGANDDSGGISEDKDDGQEGSKEGGTNNEKKKGRRQRK
ncbi:hypothetical protein F5144DRAFT_486384 [Chaetomium tenue]|uniref:Uncharacterized protein n=1 Tax=Chaetomium tenue TaxID=1854479 RepID=A0ACB7PGW0_9PEZI|nr:hypothetical protein F5144DRAFT_486384 [Chaetomium globosum]